MVFIIKKKGKYFELVENKRINWIHKRILLYYMGTKLIIPLSIIDKFKISEDNIARLKLKYQYLTITNDKI